MTDISNTYDIKKSIIYSKSQKTQSKLKKNLNWTAKSMQRFFMFASTGSIKKISCMAKIKFGFVFSRAEYQQFSKKFSQFVQQSTIWQVPEFLKYFLFRLFGWIGFGVAKMCGFNEMLERNHQFQKRKFKSCLMQ